MYIKMCKLSLQITLNQNTGVTNMKAMQAGRIVQWCRIAPLLWYPVLVYVVQCKTNDALRVQRVQDCNSPNHSDHSEGIIE